MRTNDLMQLIQQSPVAAWHGLTMVHASVAIAAGWATHANWPRIIQAGTWIAQHGGVWGIVRAIASGSGVKSETRGPKPEGNPKAEIRGPNPTS